MSESTVEAAPAGSADPGPSLAPPVPRPAEPTVTRATGPDPAEGVQPGPLPVFPAAAVALAAGLLLWLAFPRVGWWPLAPVAVAALTLATRRQRARRGAWLGWLAGLGFFVPHLQWSGVYVGALPWLALATLEAGYLAALGALLPLAWRARGGAVGTVLATAGLWVAQEALRGRTPFGGFPWGRVAFSQADAPTLGYAAVGGAPLVTAAVAAAGACLAVAGVSLLGGGSRPGLRSAGLAGVAALAVIGGGSLVPRPVDAPRTARIAAVQGNVPKAGLDFNAQRRAVLDDHVLQTQALARQVAAGSSPRPQVVLWPENSSDIDPLRNPDAGRVIQAAADAVGVPVLVGAVLTPRPGELANAGIVWGPTGSLAPGPGASYIKRHPAPFGEYIPYRSFFRRFSDKVDLVSTDFVAGTSVGVLTAGGVNLGDVICFEVAYDDLVRDPVRAGADLLVVQTNNATFGYTDESVQQLAMSRLRAVESGRSVVHISTVGVSGLITPDGRLVARSGHFTPAILQATLPLRTGQTLATRLGGLPEVLLAGAGVLIAFSGLGRGAGRRRP